MILKNTNHQGNTNKTTINYPLTAIKMAILWQETVGAGKDVVKREYLYTVCENGKQYEGSSKKWKINLL